MRPKRVTLTAAGVSAPIPISNYPSSASIAIGVKITAGTATYTVEHTFDDVFAAGFNPASAVWYSHATLVGQTTNKDGNYFAYPTAVRLNAAAVSGGGSLTMTVVQSGPSS